MEKITQEVVRSHSESELKSPPLPKRPRTDCTISNGRSGESQFHFQEPLTFQEACVTPSLTTLMPESAGLGGAAECGNDEHQKNKQQLQDIQPLVLPMNRITPLHSEEASTGSSNSCFIAPERSVLLVQDGQPPANETDKLSSYPPDDAGEALEESHTSKDASADSSSQPDCDCLGKSLEDKPPGGSNLPAGDGRDGSQVQNSFSQIQAFNLSSSDEEVRCLSDFTCAGLLCDPGFCHTCSQCAGDEPYSQGSGEDRFGENMFLNENEADSLISSIVHTDSKLCFMIPEKDPNGSMEEGVQNDAEVIKMQLCEDEDFAVWNVKTKTQVNENGMSKNPIPSAAELAERSIVSYDVVLVRNIGSETVSLEADDFCEAKRAHAAGKMIAKTGSETADHTTETPMPARISQEPAEGDNDAGPFNVIDPAIWSENDREAVEKRCDSASTAGAELSTFVEISARDIPLCPDAQPPRGDSSSVHSRTHLCKDEKNFCQSFTEPPVSLTITTNETQNSANDEGSCEWKSSPSSSSGGKTPPGTEKTQRSSNTVGQHSTEQDQSYCFLASLDDLLAQDVEYLLSVLSRMDETTQIRKGNETPDVKSDEHEKLERSSDLEEKLQGMENYREDASKMSIDDFLTEWVKEKISIQGESENNQECLIDPPHSVLLPTAQETPDESERKEAEDTQVNGSSELLVKLMDSDLKRDTTEGSPDEHTRGQSEAIKSQSEDKLIPNSQREQSIENCLWSVCLSRLETADPLVSTSPPSSDAVVPSPHEFRRPQTTDQKLAAFISHDKCPLLPSALPFCDCVPGAFDTFEKIELSRDNDGENDASLSNSPLHTSMPEKLLGTPQQQLYPTLEAESSGHEEVPQEEAEEGKEEDVERFECHTDGAADGLSSCDYSCDKLSNFISVADVPAHCLLPEPKPDCESAFKSSESFQDEPKPSPVYWEVSSESNGSASDVNNEPPFEMKQQFDKVLRELNLFFDVSRSEFACYSEESSPEQYGDGGETWESEASNSKDLLIGSEKETSSDVAEEVQRLDVCGCDPAASRSPYNGDGEQEVPLGSCQEVSMPTAEKHKEPQEMEPEKKAWSPAFVRQPLLDQLIHRPPEPNWRLEPLKTCTRPLRVGLSKKAKTKHLHRPHPYK